MIELYRGTEKDFSKIYEIIKEFNNDDFYLTYNNERVFINDPKSLKKLLKESRNIYYVDDYNDQKKGIILVWKSFGGNVNRHYVKIVADSPETAKKLLTKLLWSFKTQLFVKIKKDSQFVKAFLAKGFKFCGGRGTQILLIKEKALVEDF